MLYRSTRGSFSEKTAPHFSEVLLEGLAPDGGLYLPAVFPKISPDTFKSWASLPFPQLCAEVMALFADDIPKTDLRHMCEQAYGKNSQFHHPAIVPLVEVDENLFSLELFHGPTLAFKDMAMQLLGQLFSYVLAKKQKNILLVGATSGDTGSAAISAFAQKPHVKLAILHPQGKTSPIQRRQMTTIHAPNILNIAVPGDFDLCQTIVKNLFADQAFKTQTSLSAVNSINWARIAIQTAYFISAALKLGAPERKISFAVPTGNFGNIFAAWTAKKMGLPVGKLIIGSNRNDILTRFIQTGVMEAHPVTPSHSPSMDIQYSSNFERLLFLSLGESAEKCASLMESFKATGKMTLPPEAFDFIKKDFRALALTDPETEKAMQAFYTKSAYLADPHSAIALQAGKQYQTAGEIMVCAATAHPAKFPNIVQKTCAIWPALPDFLSDLNEREEFYDIIKGDTGLIKQKLLDFA